MKAYQRRLGAYIELFFCNIVGILRKPLYLLVLAVLPKLYALHIYA